MRTALIVRSTLLLFVLVLAGDPVLATDRPAGVVVEELDPHSPLAQAGLQVGDHVLSWQRLPAPPANVDGAQGSFESHLDWSWLEFDQDLRGPLRLLIERQGRLLTLELRPGRWKAKVRPWLPAAQLEVYTDGLELVQAGDLAAAARLWQQLAETSGMEEVENWFWLRLADLWLSNRQPERAKTAFASALRTAGSRRHLAVLWLHWGETCQSLVNMECAHGAFTSAQQVAEAKGEPLLQARALRKLGVVARETGDPAEAERMFHASLELFQQHAPGSLGESGNLNNLGVLAWERAELLLAQDFYRRAREIIETLDPDSLFEASVQFNLGRIALDRGDLLVAEACFRRTLEIRRQLVPGSLFEASSLNSLGVVAGERADWGLAESYFQQAWERTHALAPNSLDEARVLNSLGVAANGRQNSALAEQYYQRSLATVRVAAPGSLEEAMSLRNLGELARMQGKLELAQAYNEESLALQQALAPGGLDEAYSRMDLGLVAQKRGDLQLAEAHYQRALSIRQRLAPGSAYEAESLHKLALLYRERGETRKTLELLDQALAALEAQLLRFGGSRNRQAKFRAERGDYYRDATEVARDLGRMELAFHLLERSRARIFLMQLAERDAVLTADLPAALDHRRRILAVRSDQVQSQLAQLNPRDHAEEIEAVLEELTHLHQQNEGLEQEIRQASPHLAALHYPQPLDFQAARGMLDPGTLLLAFSLGEQSTDVFAVTSDAELHVETLPMGSEELRRRIESFRSRLESTPGGSRRLPGVYAQARDLYDILFAPLSERIHAAERILILPDGPLYYLPWAALRRAGEEEEQFLIEYKPIHVAVSATVYLELQQGRPQRNQAPRDALSVAPLTVASPRVRAVGFGDPLYPDAATAGSHRDAVVRSAGLHGIFDWRPLPHSRREVEALVAFYPWSGRAYLGAEATEERVKALGRDVRIVHFATHAHVDDRFPLNTFLALSIPEHLGAGRDNGLLQVWEIYEDLRLNADLVVLSACESALGEELEGEGLMGLTRAFHYAGARSVLATLWSVDDDATAELMIRFHRYLAAGLSKDEALRTAQLELIQGPIDLSTGEALDATAPRSWAAFQLYGDWR